MATNTQVERPQPATVLRDRLSRIHDACNSMQPKQAVGEMIAAMLDMPEWAALTAAPQDGAYAELPEPPRAYAGKERGAWEHGFNAGRASHGQAPAVATTYVSARECHNCGHAGINDDHATDAACNSCGWHGPSPEKDHCPGCGRDGTMTTACPMCSGVYVLVAEAHIPATTAQPAPAAMPQADSSRVAICDACGADLLEVKQSPNSYLSAEQFDADKLGDWYCKCCPKGPSKGSSTHRYFWNCDLGGAAPQADSVTAPAAGAVAGPEWKWVPVDATDDMVRATDKVNFENEDTDGTMHNVWNAMLAAAPTPAAQGDAEDAARYHHLRDCNSGSLVVMQITGTGEDDWHVLTEDDADAAIDAERAALAQKEGTTHA